MHPRHLVAAAALTLSATMLSAQTLPDGYYVQGFFGYNQLQDTNLTGNISGTPQSVSGDFDGGYGIGIAVGREIPQWSNSNIGTRVELELSYRNNDVDNLDFSGNGAGNEANTSGDISSTSLFANVLFDFKQQGAFTPFVGFGLGAQRTSYDLVYGSGVNIRDSDTTFAAQAIAGVSYDLNASTAITVDARYSRAFDVASNRLSGAGANTGTVSDDLDNLGLNLGVRFKF